MQQCVLIYDDDIEILKVCKVILETQNYRVETLSSCENILDDIDASDDHTVIVDHLHDFAALAFIFACQDDHLVLALNLTHDLSSTLSYSQGTLTTLRVRER